MEIPKKCNTNTIHFGDNFQIWSSVSNLEKMALEIQILDTLGSNNNTTVFLKQSKHRFYTTERIPELPTERSFLDFSETGLNMVHLASGRFYQARILSQIFIIYQIFQKIESVGIEKNQ